MNHNISFVSPRKENYLIMNTSNSELNLDALMEVRLEFDGRRFYRVKEPRVETLIILHGFEIEGT